MEFNKVKAYVCPVPGREQKIAAIKKMIVDAGGELICDDKQTIAGFEVCIDQCDVIVILICPETDNADYEAAIDYAKKINKRIVGIWLDETAEGGGGGVSIPAALDREGDAVVEPTIESVKKAVIEKERIWKEPDGTKRAVQKTPRHKG
ncbi:TIR domain-containing protein [Mesorhizobium sp. M0902]|uniref:hypothetical protein n=1 Tax=unclassified Mesorhizobium TaxID=325217 RepID=UPI003335C565